MDLIISKIAFFLILSSTGGFYGLYCTKLFNLDKEKNRGNKMEIEKMINRIKNHESADKIGMIASHLGIVRSFSRKGGDVEAVNVKYNMDILDNIVLDIKSMQGIVEVLVDVNEGHLKVGDELMFVAVGGDIRENVFAALMEAVNRIKKQAVTKEEIFIS